MIDNSCVDEIVTQFEGWKAQKLVVSLKSFEGNQYIDCRKWLPIGATGEYRPSKGITLAIGDWPGAMKAVNEMISRHSSTQKPLDGSQ